MNKPQLDHAKSLTENLLSTIRQDYYSIVYVQLTLNIILNIIYSQSKNVYPNQVTLDNNMIIVTLFLVHYYYINIL